MSGSLLEVRQLTVSFGAVPVLDAVDLSIAAGETLGLVGESGSGKSTLARAVLRLVPAGGGKILWAGENVLAWDARTLRTRRREMQMVFQDPLASLDPRMRVYDTLTEPLRLFEPQLSEKTRATRVLQMLARVGLPASAGERFPHEFSGGQCQRIGIARAMMCRPRLLVCDEPVSSLDVSVQGQIVNLLKDLQSEFGMAMLFISHNLSVVRHLSHRVLVLYRGRVLETAARADLFDAPRHPYTRLLLAAIPPRPGSAALSALQCTDGTAVNPQLPVDLAARGCVFYERCRYAQPECAWTPQALLPILPGHCVACRRARDI